MVRAHLSGLVLAAVPVGVQFGDGAGVCRFSFVPTVDACARYPHARDESGFANVGLEDFLGHGGTADVAGADERDVQGCSVSG